MSRLTIAWAVLAGVAAVVIPLRVGEIHAAHLARATATQPATNPQPTHHVPAFRLAQGEPHP
ncbi:hypothetical protein [Pseudoxanthomonas sp. X-1]|uniref:hypothetical protein n=1 Tax=Pseudoxanthomonas sp. X-1 TaxID=2571115 RepID=UPI001486A2A1|nr:hypothetical protein [Pseudoxanthomonas sp. X-1]UAY75206.1 hypothetical protein LAJ50_02775 [Pseudoxanthomonas sp. X-1]